MNFSIENTQKNGANIFALALGLTGLWAILLVSALLGQWNDLKILMPVQFALIFGAILFLNNPGATGKPATFRKRAFTNVRFGLILTVLFALVQFALLAIAGPEAVPYRIRYIYESGLTPVLITGLTTFGFVVVSVYISLVLFRRRMGGKRV